MAPLSDPSSQGWTTAQRTAGSGSARASKSLRRASGSNSWICGACTVGTLTFCVGGISLASPLSTTSPFWLVTRQSILTRFFSSSFSVTVATTVRVSPMRTGLVNFSSWPR